MVVLWFSYGFPIAMVDFPLQWPRGRVVCIQALGVSKNEVQRALEEQVQRAAELAWPTMLDKGD